MSERTGMYHFEVSRTAMYRVRYVLVHTSTYRHVLPCTRCTGFQMQPSPSITMCAVGAINAAQDPEAVPFFARTRQSPLTVTLAAAPCARLRERVSILCLCNTDHPAGPRIRKQDPWELRHRRWQESRCDVPTCTRRFATFKFLKY
jgi:hypothetical protein